MSVTSSFTQRTLVARGGFPRLASSVTFQAPSRSLPQRSAGITAAAGEKADLSGEWPVNWSLASYEDVGEFFQNSLFKDSAAPGTQLRDVMSEDLTVTTPDTSIQAAKKLLAKVTGVPVVKSNSDWTLIGVLSKKDLDKPGSTVKDAMSTPPIAARTDNKVADAACLMLKHKVHRIPVVDSSAKVVGIVTRTDIFTALENEQGSIDVKVKL